MNSEQCGAEPRGRSQNMDEDKKLITRHGQARISHASAPKQTRSIQVLIPKSSAVRGFSMRGQDLNLRLPGYEPALWGCRGVRFGLNKPFPVS